MHAFSASSSPRSLLSPHSPLSPRSLPSPGLRVVTSDCGLRAKIKILDDFQYTLAKGPSDDTAMLRTESSRRSTGMHVSELWSKKQHKLFLRTLNAFSAQKARERIEREKVLRGKKKQLSGRTLDQLYSRLVAYDDPETAVRNYSMGRKGLVLQEIESGRKAAGATVSRKGDIQVSGVSTPKLRKALEDLIGKCSEYEELIEKKSPVPIASRNDKMKRDAMRVIHMRQKKGQWWQ